MFSYKDGDRVRLVSRNGVDHTRRFHDLAAAVAKLSARTLVLDGEVAIYDQHLRSRFEWLREPDPDAVASPPVVMAFDVLYYSGRDVTARPLRWRRARLEVPQRHRTDLKVKQEGWTVADDRWQRRFFVADATMSSP
jgi:bifunctional non-homologous end joining protein LigD